MKLIFSLVFVSLLFVSSRNSIAQVGGEVEEGNQFGWSLAVGDFNGDSVNDLAVSSPWDSGDSGVWSGAVHIFLGTPNGLSDVASQTFTAADTLGYNIQSRVRMGSGLSAGDFNGDQFDDLALGGIFNEDANGINTGAVAILNGSSTGLVKTGLPAIQKENVAGRAGFSLSSGDINGDQFADLVVFSPNRGDQEDQGELDIYYGSADGISTVGSQVLTQNNLIGSAVSFGFSTELADFNNDGFDDLAVGIPSGSASTDPGMEGLIDIYYGSSGGIDATANVRFTQLGDAIAGTGEADDSFGHSIKAGDFNMDGFADIVVGSPNENSGVTESSGAVNVILGSSDGLTADNDFIIGQGNPGGISTSAEEGDQFGWSFASADFNNDGFADIAISAIGETDSDQGSGLVHLLFGDEGGFNTEADSLIDISDFQILNEDIEIEFGGFGNVMVASDFNGDSFPDLVIATPSTIVQGEDHAGAIFVVYGSAGGLDLTQVEIWHQNSNPTSTSSENLDLADIFEISIYPNPFTSTLNLNIKGDAFGSYSLKVFDMMGREVFQTSSSSSRLIWQGTDSSGSKLPNGSYLVEIVNEKGSHFASVTLLR